MLWLVGLVIAVLVVRMLLRLNVATCEPKADMTGKVAIVTGANTGIGYETAKGLAIRGAKVILACRNDDRGTRARDQIIQETGNENVVYKQLDLASLTSVRKFCEDVKRSETRLDVLVNNAGVYSIEDRLTEDGIVQPMQVNVFSPMLLTDILLPLLKQSQHSRIVNVSSLLQYLGVLDVKKINKPGSYGNFRMYCNTKYGNMLFTQELARRLEGSGVCVAACHPGVAHTGLVTGDVMGLLFALLCWFLKRSPAEAAATQIHLSACSGAQPGTFYVDRIRWPAFNCTASAAKELWSCAENLMRCRLENMAYPHSKDKHS